MVSLVSVRRLQRDLGAILQQRNAEWHTYLRTFFRVANLQQQKLWSLCVWISCRIATLSEKTVTRRLVGANMQPVNY